MNIVSAQLNYVVGDFEQNANKICRVIAQSPEADWIVLSELSLSGYYPMDLLNVEGFYETQQMYLEQVIEATKGSSAFVVLGAVTKNVGEGKPWFNSLLIIRNGSIVRNYNKQLLPTYDVFDERRHFEPGFPDPVIFTAPCGTRLGFLICEDIWNDDGKSYPVNPVEALAREGIDVLISINASPAAQEKRIFREQMVQQMCKKYQFSSLYVNQVGGADALVFDGSSFAINRDGEVSFRAPSYEEDVTSLTYNQGFGPSTISELVEGPAQWEAQLVMGIKDYFSKTGPGFSKALIGCSGGIDSAVVLALAVKALGAENVTAITMPSCYSSQGSVSDSVTLCENLGVRLLTIPIQGIVDSYQTTLGDIPELGKWSGLALENAQARVRGMLLMGWSNQLGALVLSTGNKSEMSVGYATLYGDMNGALNPLGDLYKMEVYALARWLNTNGPCIPEAIIDKAPSAELAPGQKDDDSLPPYPILDAMLRLNIEGHLLTQEERVKLEDIARSNMVQYRDVLKKLERAEFKRRQAPPIIRVHPRAFGSGWQFPVAHQYQQWNKL